ncbi:uroporphyrinogen decarboxylase [Spongiactinospora rosea]|uniref:Uroporphyrinogen decarboxylase n=1 Tax=Spongiactinospora rosea TaxID=2248750 RepID=A0A366M0Q2_9ACTN|nr:uroporphyrinogen decarboxylase [Spongiactinospora rosea]
MPHSPSSRRRVRARTAGAAWHPVRVNPAESPFVRACRRLPVPHTPVWYMRQAGRSLPEYRALREGVPMLTACATPDLIVEITMQPVRRHGVDAAIFFSDIVVPLKAIGVDLDIKPGVGPVVADPIRSTDALGALRPIEPDDVPYVGEAVRGLVKELGPVPLIGFAGAPFTLASYLIEGGPSKNHDHTKAMMYGEPALWHDLMDRLTDITIGYLRIQAEAGASALQLFDSWVGAVAPDDYRAFVLPHTSRIFAALADLDVPRIHFGVGTGELLGLLGEAGADVVGVDWRVPLDRAAERIGPGRAVQGNLDPAVLLAPWEVIESRARDALERGRAAEGHVFNLGHGVLPSTDPGALTRLTEFVHAFPVS